MSSSNSTAIHSPSRPAVQSWRYVENHNFFSAVNYINHLFDLRARLLVIRIDLSFQHETQGQYDAEYARACFQRLLNNRRSNSIFRNLMGYIWVLEYGQERGFHYHCIFFYDGHYSQQDITISHRIGAYWRDAITQGAGCYYSCNDSKETLAKRGFPIGVGMIHRNNMQSREDLIWITTYLLKETEEDGTPLHTVLPESLRRFRSFGHGEISNR